MNKSMRIRKFFRHKTALQLGLVIFSVVLVGMVILAAGGCGGWQESPPRIGVIVPLTGGAADFGKWARQGVEIALEELKSESASGDLGVKAIYEDNQMDPKLGLAAFKKLREVDGVIGVITSGSGVVLAIAPEGERTKTVQLNHSAVNPDIRKAGEYTFSLVNDAKAETRRMAELAIDVLGINEMAILYANTAYGVGTKDAMVESFVAAGGRVIGTVAFPENFTDMRTHLLKLREMQPEATYFIATIKDSGKLLKQAAEVGVETQWLSFNAFESPEVIDIAGPAAEGVIYTSSNLFDLPDPGARPRGFIEAYVTKYGERPNLYAATAYDAAHLLFAAYRASGGDRRRVQQYLSAVSNYEAASGRITFDEDGAVEKPMFLKIVEGGEFVVFEHSSRAVR
ncbi:MAG: ABC transporter substrate-binding protein [Candidatus Eisenbacteria bacterium]